MKYAIINGNVVANIILIDDETDATAFVAEAFPGQHAVKLADGDVAVIGGTLNDDGTFSLPVQSIPPVVVPSSVTMRQARLALLQQGKYAAVQAAVASGDTAAQIEWEFALTVDRASPLLATIAGPLGLDLDSLFTLAATL